MNMYPSPSFEGMPKGYIRIRSMLICLIFLAAAARKLFGLEGFPDFPKAVALLLLILILYITLPLLSRRFPRYVHMYFVIQTVLALSYGLLQPYEDTWGLLFLIIGMQIGECYLPQLALILGIILFLLMTMTMVLTHGLLQGLGYSMTYLAGGIILISFNLMYVQAEKAKAESQRLLNDLQQAHQRLKASAGQTEALAASQERNRLTHELHDSVSQIIFSITLTAQSARILVDKDPSRLSEQLDRLQELTGRALSQMRALISQWRPE
jgi:signal transduction histidine kinase